jgi:predicted ATPase/DNA-binding SARP family transcriptional activator
VEFRVLGPLEVLDAQGRRLALGGPKQRALLAVLLLHAGQVVAVERLVDELWGEHPPDTAAHTLQVYVANLRKVLEPDRGRGAAGGVLRTRPGGYLVQVGPDDLDLARFERLTSQGQAALATDPARASRLLGQALDLWRGPALAGVVLQASGQGEVARLEERRLAAVENRIQAELALGRHHELTGELGALVAAHPLRERLHGQLLLALYRAGRQAEALAAYRRTRQALAEELGIDPGRPLQDLERAILAQDPALDWTPAAAEPAPPAAEPSATAPALAGGRPAPLPGILDQTVGRDADITRLAALLGDAGGRLVTVLGPGGVGKTRLAVEVGRRLAGQFRDGVCFVPLAVAQKPDDVADTVCTALGVSAGQDPAAAAEAALTTRNLLLVCDNFEHVTDAAVLLPRLLAAAPGVRVLVTSRQRLGLRGEHEYLLEPLDTAAADPASAPAVQLFLAHARAAGQPVDPDAGGALGSVAAVCQACDGLPLAIELAAARLRLLTLGELRDHLTDPLALLTSGGRDLPERQRTLRTTIAWSVAALPAAQARLLAQLTVFRGGFTIAAAAAVAGLTETQTMDGLAGLLDNSLLRRIPGPDQQSRFALLETIREYAADLLDTDHAEELRQRHARFFQGMIGGAEPDPSAHSGPAWRAQLAERPNIRQAIRWALTHDDPTLAADLIVGTGFLWSRLGPQDELAQWLTELLALDDLPPARRFDALYRQALMGLSAERAVGSAPLDAAQRIAENIQDEQRLALALALRGYCELHTGRVQEAASLTISAAELSDRHPEWSYVRMWVLDNGAYVALYQGDLDLAAQRNAEARRIARENHYQVMQLDLTFNFCEILFIGGDPRRALDAATEGFADAQELGDADGIADMRSQRGYAYLLLGETSAAEEDLRAALDGHLRCGTWVYGLEDLIRLAATWASEKPQDAARALGTYLAAGVTSGEPTTVEVLRRLHEQLPTRLGDRFEGLVEEGRAMVAECGIPLSLARILSLQ